MVYYCISGWYAYSYYLNDMMNTTGYKSARLVVCLLLCDRARISRGHYVAVIQYLALVQCDLCAHFLQYKDVDALDLFQRMF
jgi:general stress protein CsbA